MKLQQAATASLSITLLVGPLACGGHKSTGSTTASTVAVTGVTLDQSTLALRVGGGTVTLTATVAPSDATNKAITWTSSNTAVATVSSGVVTPVGAGIATLTATTADGAKTATCVVTVTVPVTGVSLDQSTLSLALGGGTSTLTATVSPSNASDKVVTWTSSDTRVVTVSGGVLTPVASGTATITATTEDGSKTASCGVTVYVPVSSVTLDQSTLSLRAGLAVGTLTAAVLPTDATYPSLTWASSDTSVATVSGGVVTPLSAGTATITATSADGLGTASCALTVAAAAGPQLIAIGTLDGATDLSGLTGTLENGNSEAILGGMGSGLAWAGGYTFLALPDRGPNATAYDATVDNTTSYIPRFHTLKMELASNTSGSSLPYTLSVTLADTKLLSSPTELAYSSSSVQALTDVQDLNTTDGVYYFVGRSDCFASSGDSGATAHARLDPESIRVANDGQSVFISDEYGPYVYQFDRHTGQRLASFSLPSGFDVATLSAVGQNEIDGNTSGRVANKGMEGLAITPDGTTLVGLMQSPLIQDGGDGGRCNRIVTIDIATGTTHQYVYDNYLSDKSKAYNSSEILAVNDHVFLIDERDGKGLGDGSSAVVKRLYKVDISDATELPSDASGQATLLTYAVSKTLFLDLESVLSDAGIADTAIPAKIEGAAFGPDITVNGINKHTLWIANDNDFIRDTAGPNRIYVFAVSDADLGSSTYVAQDVTEDSSTSTAVAGITLSPTTLALTTGGSDGVLTPVVLPSFASNKALSWTSSNSAAATVTGGLVTPVAAGSSIITATTLDGSYQATCTVTVTAPTVSVTGVSLDQSSLNLAAGGSDQTLSATVSPSSASNSTVTWSSSDTSVATVTNGVVHAVAAGTATITVTTADGGYQATCAVMVTASTVNVTGVSLDKSALTLSGLHTLTATLSPSTASDSSVTWSSSDTSVATVTNGVVTAVGQGTADITVTTTDGNHTAKCALTIAPFYAFASDGSTWAKYGTAGAWISEATETDVIPALVVTQDGNTFYGALSGTNNGYLYRKTGAAGTWAPLLSSTASGTMKALAFDGTNFYGFTNTGKYNTTTLSGSWAASNLGGTSGLALVSAVFDGSTFYGFTSTGALYTNTPANVTTANTWAVASSNAAAENLVSVTWDGTTFYGATAAGHLYSKTGSTGSWVSFDTTDTASSTLVSMTCQ
nr:Ig-like domain-containing protein [uncultured Holophaga sp.]